MSGVRVEVIETSGLGDRSYLVICDDTAVVIDPQRDIDRILDLARHGQFVITHVLETHLHNDYVTGGLELSRAAHAEYGVPGSESLGYPHRRLSDGDTVDPGPFRLRVIHTPGHTPEHVSFVLEDQKAGDIAVFTGGSMLFDATGRTDLLGDEHTRELTTAQYRSVRRLADELPTDADVYPTHGFGSFCAATSVGRDASTVGEQFDSNPALTQDERAFVDQLLANLSEYPAYYAHMGVINRDGPAAIDLSPLRPVDICELRQRIDTGEWVVDLRDRVAYAAGHFSGSLGFELSDSFVTYLGWLYAWGTPLTLIGDDEDQVAGAQRELARIGVGNLAGAVTGDVGQHHADEPLRSYRVADFAELASEIGAIDGGRATARLTVLDVRRADEFDDAHVIDAVNIPIHHLIEKADQLPDDQIWVHCASGYRASVAASILDGQGHDVVLINDGFAAAEKLGLTSR